MKWGTKRQRISKKHAEADRKVTRIGITALTQTCKGKISKRHHTKFVKAVKRRALYNRKLRGR